MQPAKGACIAHVGLPKTGSTYLQIHYFGRLQAAEFFSTTRPLRWPAELNSVWPANWLWHDDLLGNAAVSPLDRRRQRYAKQIARLLSKWTRAARRFAGRSRCPGLCLISAEGFCGLAPEVNAVMVSLLKQAGVERVLFVCRHQADYAQSLWPQFLLAEDRLARFVPFELQFVMQETEGMVGLDWNAYINQLDAAFGPKNVLVLPYELLRANAPAFFERVNNFLGLGGERLSSDSAVRENPLRRDFVYQGLTLDDRFPFNRLPWRRRRLHRLVARFPQALPRRLICEHSMVLPQDVLVRFQSRFALAHERLEARIGLDLKAYGDY